MEAVPFKKILDNPDFNLEMFGWLIGGLSKLFSLHLSKNFGNKLFSFEKLKFFEKLFSFERNKKPSALSSLNSAKLSPLITILSFIFSKKILGLLLPIIEANAIFR